MCSLDPQTRMTGKIPSRHAIYVSHSQPSLKFLRNISLLCGWMYLDISGNIWIYLDISGHIRAYQLNQGANMDRMIQWNIGKI